MIRGGLGLSLLLALTGLAAHAEAPGKLLFEQGSEQVPACAGCHGPEGWGNAEGPYPALSGQVPGYLAKQLADFHDGTRKNEVMGPIAEQLTPRQRDQLVAYIGTLPVPAPGPAGDQALGKRIAELGKWEVGVPPCETCHGRNGIGTHFPALAAQQASYIVAAFEAFRNGSRKNDPLGLMQHVAERLSTEEIAAVAQYFQSLRRQK